ncbi:unnamed protein product [Brassica oleracea]|uniref:Uncharacterized protein n=1 Tax=Brassica oleracea TaxID=3712 RepID=A0A3P6GCD2_BRAOL|nr:unnamed protein product [Brassica oleracea]
MAEHCMVVPGAWTSVGSLWEFVIDKKKISRILPVRSGMSLRELQNNVAKEFFTFTDPPPLAQMSYWPPNTKELATGLTTPPGEKPRQTTADDSSQTFATPNQPIIPNPYPFRPIPSASSRIPSFSLFDEDELLQYIPIQQPDVHTPLTAGDTSPPTGPSKINRFSIGDENLSC